MRKMISLLLAAVFAVSLAACGHTNEKSVASVQTETQSKTDTAQEAADAAQSDSTAAEETEADGTETLEETVVYEENGLRITTTALEKSGLFGPEVKLLFENDGTQSYIIQPAYCIVNGYMIDPQMSVELAAGKKANDSLILMRSALEACGIDTITDVSFVLSLIDPDSYMTLSTSQPITLTTSAAGSYQQSYDDSGEEIYNADGLRIVAKNIQDSLMGKDVVLYLDNTSDRPLLVQTDDISVNGFMVTGSFSCEVQSAAKAVDEILLLSSSLEENGIETVEDVEFSLRIIDPDSYAAIATSDPITLSF